MATYFDVISQENNEFNLETACYIVRNEENYYIRALPSIDNFQQLA